MRFAIRLKTVLFCTCLLFLISTAVCYATVGDSRFGMSGGCSPIWDKYDEVGSSWFLNWGMSLNTYYVNSSYPYVRMYWRTNANEYTDAQIQDWALTARLLYGPGVPIWWTASNEPNDRGQANQTPTDFAAGYYQYYKNLKIGDPDCKVLGPGILNWTFQSDSVWQKGQDWYAEFRQVWFNNPTYSAYSMTVQGNPYPPMDAFNMHTYDLRGIQGTPWVGPADWKYLRDETLACYSSLQNYPETKNLKIWNTEYGALRVSTLTDSADTLGGIGLWFRQQPFMERWFFFIAYTGDASWQQTVLFDNSRNITSLGKAHYTLSTMGNAEVYNLPFNATYDSGTPYTRPGSTYSYELTENYDYGLNIYPKQGSQYLAGQMRGRTYNSTRRIRRITFNYRMTCDPSLYQIEMDTPGHTGLWSSGSSTGDQWADIDLSAYNLTQISLGLYCKADNTYLGTTGSSKAQISNITLWFDNAVNVSPAQAKSLPDYRHVKVDSVVVSGVFSDCFAAQRGDRSAGILVKSSTKVTAGDRCAIEGDTVTVGGLRMIANAVVSNQTPGLPPKPITMNSRALGGGTDGLQGGVIDNAASDKYAAGLSNIGLLVKAAGKVSYVDPWESFFYLDDGSGIDDGSGHRGVRVSLAGSQIPATGTSASVVGVCSAMTINGKLARYLRARDIHDYQFSAVLPANPIQNRGFETGDLTNWLTVNAKGAVVSSNAYGITPASGNYFFNIVTSYYASTGTIYQTVPVTAGTNYYATALSRVYHSNNTSTAVKNRIGIDPTGGTNAYSSRVIWSDWDMQELTDTSEWRMVTSPVITAAASNVTVFLRYYQEQMGLHVNCFDNVTLIQAQ